MQKVQTGFGYLFLEVSLRVAIAIQDVVTEQQLAVSIDLG